MFDLKISFSLKICRSNLLDYVALAGCSSPNPGQCQQHKSPSYGHQRSSQKLWGGGLRWWMTELNIIFSWIDWLRPTRETNVRRTPGVCGRLSLCLVCLRDQWEVHGLYIWYVLQVGQTILFKTYRDRDTFCQAILERWETEVRRQGNKLEKLNESHCKSDFE